MSAKIVELTSIAAASPGLVCDRVVLLRKDSDGTLWVLDASGRPVACDWMVTPWTSTVACGDELVALIPASEGRGVVVGRIGRWGDTTAAPTVTIQASESLSLTCGQSSIDLRADGKVMIRGEDVLVRAKRTKRIRAGTVSIN